MTSRSLNAGVYIILEPASTSPVLSLTAIPTEVTTDHLKGHGLSATVGRMTWSASRRRGGARDRETVGREGARRWKGRDAVSFPGGLRLPREIAAS